MSTDDVLSRHVNKAWPGKQDTIAEHIRREARAVVIVDMMLEAIWNSVKDELASVGAPTAIPGLYQCDPDDLGTVVELLTAERVLYQVGDMIHTAAELAGLSPDDRDVIKADLERERAALAMLGGFEGNESR